MRFFPLEKLSARVKELRSAIHRERRPITIFRYRETQQDESAYEQPDPRHPDFDDGDWADFTLGDTWGGYDKVAWFRATVEVPEAWHDRKLALRFLVGPRDGGDSTAETLLYVNGEALQGIDVWHEEAWLPPETYAQGRVHIALRSWSGVLGVPPVRRFKVAELVRVDEGAQMLYYLADTVLKTLKELDERDWHYQRLLNPLHQAFLMIDHARPLSDEFYRSVAGAAAYLQGRLDELRDGEAGRPVVNAVGHAHIDLAWLWRQAHSREKASRTFATVLHLMRQYPEYRFMHSSPQLYRWLEHDHPELFARVAERIASGEWEITGGMWVESDTNLPSGEALIRQIVHGKRYMKDTFGVDTKVLWLPDVFGYSAVLPQILQKSGIPYFVTTKISWNQFNRMPHDTFNWRGIDGSEVLTHFITTPERNSHHYTYNGELDPREIAGIWREYRQKDVNDELLLAFGWGDGGGGPTREMLEAARVMNDLPGLPKVRQGHVEPFFERLAQRLAQAELPVWDGELYLEYHRGTYTTQAALKRDNRRNEVRLHDAEWAAGLAGILTGAEYPNLDEAWELLLYNQFHDVLPGSSIAPVYVDSERDQRRIEELAEQAFEEAARRLSAYGSHLPGKAVAVAVGADAGHTVGPLLLNSLGWPRAGTLELPWSEELANAAALDDAGKPLPAQTVGEGADDGGGRLRLLQVPAVPAFGYRRLRLGTSVNAGIGEASSGELLVTERSLENRNYRLEIDERGQLSRLFDKTNHREVLAPGRSGNVLQAFEDKPLNFDAWDIDPYYRDSPRSDFELLEMAVEESGPLRGVLRLRWRLGRSEIRQRIVLRAGERRIDFHTEVDWRERQTLLKVAFPVQVRSRQATYDIGFGVIERPSHWNTSWDWAKFEVPAHKWADLSEGNYGVALLNDCKYGYDIKDDVMRLTLLRSPISPDPEADLGRHEFTYSLLPHAGDWRAGDVVRQAYELNVPLRVQPVSQDLQAAGTSAAESFGLLEVGASNVVVETLKRAEDSDGWVLRCYEAEGFRLRDVILRFALPVRGAALCDLLENVTERLEPVADTLTLAFSPFEIVTLKLWF